ncbi:zinc finger, RING-CH-type containing protein [Tanacetum coccineum]
MSAEEEVASIPEDVPPSAVPEDELPSAVPEDEPPSAVPEDEPPSAVQEDEPSSGHRPGTILVHLLRGDDEKNLLGWRLMVAASSSDRITKDEQDLEGGSIVTCRICLQCNGLEDEDLISPCMCKGTQQLVHRACLDHWRSVKIIGGLGGLAYLADKHGFLKKLFNNSWDRILSRHPIPIYYCVGLIMFFVLVGFIGVILDCCCIDDGELSCCTSCAICPGQDSVSTELCLDIEVIGLIIFLIIFVILGIAYGLFAAIFVIQRIAQRHYHILAKRELTKEYVVEDLKGHYTLAELDPEHMERLKTLKLM